MKTILYSVSLIYVIIHHRLQPNLRHCSVLFRNIKVIMSIGHMKIYIKYTVYEIMYLFFWMCYSIRLTWRISRKLNNVASIWLKIINTHVIIILFWTRQHILYCFVLYRHSQKSQIYTIFLDIWTVLVHNCVFSPLKSRVYATFPSSIFHWSNSVTVYPVRPYHESRWTVKNITSHRMWFPFFFKPVVLDYSFLN